MILSLSLSRSLSLSLSISLSHTHTQSTNAHTHTHKHTLTHTQTYALTPHHLRICPALHGPFRAARPRSPSRPPHVSDSPEVQTLEYVEVRDGAGEGHGAGMADFVATGAAEARLGREGDRGKCLVSRRGRPPGAAVCMERTVGGGAKTPILLTESQPASAVQK